VIKFVLKGNRGRSEEWKNRGSERKRRQRRRRMRRMRRRRGEGRECNKESR